MKLTQDQLWWLVKCSEWLESGEENPDSETKAMDREYRKLSKRLKQFYETNEKAEYKLS